MGEDGEQRTVAPTADSRPEMTVPAAPTANGCGTAPPQQDVKPVARPSAPPRERLSFRLSASLVAELRGAVVQIGGPLRLTLDGLAARALGAALERLRAEHNGGRPFQVSPRGALRPGRPVGG